MEHKKFYTLKEVNTLTGLTNNEIKQIFSPSSQGIRFSDLSQYLKGSHSKPSQKKEVLTPIKTSRSSSTRKKKSKLSPSKAKLKK